MNNLEFKQRLSFIAKHQLTRAFLLEFCEKRDLERGREKSTLSPPTIEALLSSSVFAGVDFLSNSTSYTQWHELTPQKPNNCTKHWPAWPKFSLLFSSYNDSVRWLCQQIMGETKVDWSQTWSPSFSKKHLLQTPLLTILWTHEAFAKNDESSHSFWS